MNAPNSVNVLNLTNKREVSVFYNSEDRYEVENNTETSLFGEVQVNKIISYDVIVKFKKEEVVVDSRGNRDYSSTFDFEGSIYAFTKIEEITAMNSSNVFYNDTTDSKLQDDQNNVVIQQLSLTQMNSFKLEKNTTFQYFNIDRGFINNAKPRYEVTTADPILFGNPEVISTIKSESQMKKAQIGNYKVRMLDALGSEVIPFKVMIDKMTDSSMRVYIP
jgi:hypothetical protein